MFVYFYQADSVDSQSLLRVYGALMWSLGKVVRIPEASRVYMGSFWDAPLKKEGRDNVQLLNREKSDLMSELNLLPRQAAVRRINELIKRSRSVKVHAYIIHYLRKQMPYLLGRSDVQRQLIGRLDKEFLACARRYNLPWGDFPSVDKYRAMLSEVKQFLSEFKRLDKNMIREMDKVMTVDIPKLLEAATAQTSSSQNGISRPDSNGK
jgi:EH domain-containing protein 1